MTQQQNQNSQSKWTPILWAATAALFIGMLFARIVYPELTWLSIVIGAPLVGVLVALIRANMQSLRGRTAAYGLNSAVTVLLVLGIVAVINFMGERYPQKLDLTKNRAHTLSDQTVKLIKGLQSPVKAVLFGKTPQREQNRPLLDSYKALNPKFEVEFVDPDRELTRAKKEGIKKYGTLQLISGTRDAKIDEPSEEKITNALIKLLKEKSPTLCAVTGHGERSFASQEADGYSSAKKQLEDQSYVVKDLNLVSDLKDGKIPDTCDAIAILGPAKSYFAPEIQAVRSYLENGGRAVIALDFNFKGTGEPVPELIQLLAGWNVRVENAMIVDPLSKMMGVDASMPIIATYSKDSAITKEMQIQCAFPFARPLGVIAGAPTGLTVQWMAQTTAKSWAVTDMKQLAAGQVQYTPGKDKMGPLDAAIMVEGKLKDSKASRNTRIAVFAGSLFASNNYGRFGGNLDFFLNSVSWAMEDESLISIRAKDNEPGKVELSDKQSKVIFLLNVIVIPLLVSIAGIAFWVIRRRL